MHAYTQNDNNNNNVDISWFEREDCKIRKTKQWTIDSCLKFVSVCCRRFALIPSIAEPPGLNLASLLRIVLWLLLLFYNCYYFTLPDPKFQVKKAYAFSMWSHVYVYEILFQSLQSRRRITRTHKPFVWSVWYTNSLLFSPFALRINFVRDDISHYFYIIS